MVLIRWPPLWLLVAAIEGYTARSDNGNEFALKGLGTSWQADPANPVAAESLRRPSILDYGRRSEGVVAGHPGSRRTMHRESRRHFGGGPIAGQGYGAYGRRRRSNRYVPWWSSRRRARTRRGRKYNRYSPLEDVCTKGFDPVIPAPPVSPPKAKGIRFDAHCRLRLVADQFYIMTAAKNSTVKAEMLMTLALLKVNEIFNNTAFRPSQPGLTFGLGAADMRDWPDIWNKDSPYFQVRDVTNLYQILQYFAWTDVRINEAFCGAVLFTIRDFAACQEIGVGYVGNSTNDVGICSIQRKHIRVNDKYNEYITPNVAVVNPFRKSKLLPRTDEILSLAHGLGNIMGAPTVAKSKNIMGDLAITDGRIMKFTQDSIEKMKAVLEYKQSCWQTNGLCGNRKLDPSEECDEGHMGGPCCDINCRFKKDAVCSDFNSDCCEQCRIEPATHYCRRAMRTTCRGAAKCTGTSAACSPSPIAKDQAPCGNYGLCKNGTCRSFCDIIGFPSCQCTGDDACKICCESRIKCEPFVPNIYADDGTPCGGKDNPGGVCFQKQCVAYCKQYNMEGCVCPDGVDKQLCCKIDKDICRPMLYLS